jgi:hypothetical protein
MIDVSNIINEYGEDVILYERGEAEITRDKYNSIISSQSEGFPPQYNFKCYPIDHQPNRQQMEKAGIREQCECIAWFAMKDIIDNGLSFDGIDSIRYSVIIDNNEYGIRDKGRVEDFADEHLYLTLGLYKK